MPELKNNLAGGSRSQKSMFIIQMFLFYQNSPDYLKYFVRKYNSSF